MKILVLTALLVVSGRTGLEAQTLEKLNLQAHGYVAQGFIASSGNEWDSTNSSSGSAAWTDAVLNLTSQPTPNVRFGAQARYLLLGDLSDRVALDWAQADIKFNEHLGVRAGKVKSPSALFNEEQDIDPAYIWVLLPESIYPIASRDSLLAHYGGVVYGRAVLGERLGKLQYRGFGGERVIGGNDGVFDPLRDAGLLLPSGLHSPVIGAAVRWESPVRGLIIGASEDIERGSGPLQAGPLSGQLQSSRTYRPYFFAKYERNKSVIAGEYSRFSVRSNVILNGLPPSTARLDARSFYVMASHGFTGKLTGGIYYSSENNLSLPVSAARFQKDWAICGRYDFSPYLYLKLEQHIIDGTLIGYSNYDNPSGLQPNARMTLLKIGASF